MPFMVIAGGEEPHVATVRVPGVTNLNEEGLNAEAAPVQLVLALFPLVLAVPPPHDVIRIAATNTPTLVVVLIVVRLVIAIPRLVFVEVDVGVPTPRAH